MFQNSKISSSKTKLIEISKDEIKKFQKKLDECNAAYEKRKKLLLAFFLLTLLLAVVGTAAAFYLLTFNFPPCPSSDNEAPDNSNMNEQLQGEQDTSLPLTLTADNLETTFSESETTAINGTSEFPSISIINIQTDQSKTVTISTTSTAKTAEETKSSRSSTEKKTSSTSTSTTATTRITKRIYPTTTTEYPEYCGKQDIKPRGVYANPNGRIVGGDTAVPNSWPWVVSIRKMEGNKLSDHIQTGVIIARRFILTCKSFYFLE